MIRLSVRTSSNAVLRTSAGLSALLAAFWFGYEGFASWLGDHAYGEDGFIQSDAAGAAYSVVVVLAAYLIPWSAVMRLTRRSSVAVRRAALIVLCLYSAVISVYKSSDYASLFEFHREVWSVYRAHAVTRAAMQSPPEQVAQQALARGDSSFLGVHGYSLYVPLVENWCVWQRWGVRVIDGTGDSLIGFDDLQFQGEAARYATAYNRHLIRRLGVPSAQLARAPLDNRNCDTATPRRKPGRFPAEPIVAGDVRPGIVPEARTVRPHAPELGR